MNAEVELLREAAKTMRERAKAASPGPWDAAGNDGLVWSSRPGDPVSGSTEIPDAEHIASWHPAVALAVADLLDETAGHLESHIPAWTAPPGIDDPPGLCWNNPERLASLIEHHHGRALAVARAYLGSES